MEVGIGIFRDSHIYSMYFSDAFFFFLQFYVDILLRKSQKK